jgi:hypothetical protein
MSDRCRHLRCTIVIYRSINNKRDRSPARTFMAEPALSNVEKPKGDRFDDGFKCFTSPPGLGSTRAWLVCGGQRRNKPPLPDIFSGFPPWVATFGLPGCQGGNRDRKRRPRPGLLPASRIPEAAARAGRDDADRPAGALYPQCAHPFRRSDGADRGLDHRVRLHQPDPDRRGRGDHRRPRAAG